MQIGTDGSKPLGKFGRGEAIARKPLMVKPL
jgi:hypothetical protein